MRIVLIFSILALLFVGLVAARRTFRSSPKSLSSNLSDNRKSSRENPFGVMLGGKNIQTASKLGVAYYRPVSVFLDRDIKSCEECDQAINMGLKLILTVRNNGRPQVPTTPPTDLIDFKNKIGQVIERYKPDLLVVENEENSQALFYAGSAQDYHEELKAACEVAHAKNTKCTNGGLVSSLVALLVAEHYRDQGSEQKAQDFLKRTISSKYESKLGSNNLLDEPKVKSQIKKGRELLEGYKAADIDYVNFHWYIQDTQALEEAVNYLKTLTSLTPMTNEVGQQQNESPEQVTNVMQKIVDLGLPYAIWFSLDIPGFGGARGLVDSNGNLRPNGEAFKNFIQANY